MQLPQVFVAVTCVRRENPVQFLLGSRKRDPSLGKLGWYTQKVELSRSLQDTAAECLEREAGLVPQHLAFAGVSRFVDTAEGAISQDVLLVCFVAESWHGSLISESANTKNAWYTLAQLNHHPNLFAGLIQQLGSVQYNKYIFSDNAAGIAN